MCVLTNQVGEKAKGRLLTNKRDVPFVLGFRYPLEKKFTLTELENETTKNFKDSLTK